MAKAQHEYTIHNVLHNIPKFLRETMNDEQLDQFESNLKYLSTLANAMTYAKVAARSFTETFNKPFYEYTPQEINKAIAECLKSPDPIATDFQLARLNQCKDSQLMKYDNSRLITRQKDLLKSIDSRKSDINNYYKSIDTQLTRLVQLRKELDEVEVALTAVDANGHNAKVVEAIQEVIASGKWLYLGSFDDADENPPKMLAFGPYNTNNTYSSNGTFTLRGHIFLATEPTVCSHISRSKTVKRANFGHAIVALDSTGKVKRAAFALDAYASYYTSLHPHLSSDGSVCWGNAGSAYVRMVEDAKPNYLNILTLFTSLMETYSPENPYQRIEIYLDKNVVKRHAVLLDENSINLVPTEFLTSILTPEQIAEHQANRALALIRNDYLHANRTDNRVRWEDLPLGFRTKLEHLADSAKNTWEAIYKNNNEDHTAIKPEDVANHADLTEAEWNLLHRFRQPNITNVRAYIILANYLRFKATGKQLAMRYNSSLTRWCEFTSDSTFLWDGTCFDYFNTDVVCRASDRQDVIGGKHNLNSGDTVTAVTISFDDFVMAVMAQGEQQ